ASATPTFSSANSLAFSDRVRCRPRAALAAARFQNVRAVAPQKRALWVWSAVRVALTASPTSLTSLTSSAYSSLVSAGGPSGRKYDGLGMTKGVVVAIVG